ncbi:YqeG family HAD IIIA-type phosphatase [Bombilactobacillus folatiphilus]|uniref:YqeG family HAD IIIA-type phosphatase n=1 Tax=Bombilactobacillus folatiphilus TaxID=2923362 RepID=A0ABY4PA69_9LACO|nr:YqeG family HAD IIIA-type phosphatase [Bombilactobacillus folatiphilus]UQS82541.1 YqeG family HAD IIIA-type phosphatase [Bombilactobacillus folatiphilus]
MMLEQITWVTPQEFIQAGVKVILSDLDNTLLPWNQKEQHNQNLVDWIQALKANGITLVIASNNSEERVKKAVADLPVQILARALKPLPFGLHKYLRQHHYRRQETVMVGDQLMTDVLAGNLAGVRTILVQPLVQTDAKKTRINRLIERPIMKLNHFLYPHLRWRRNLIE